MKVVGLQVPLSPQLQPDWYSHEETSRTPHAVGVPLHPPPVSTQLQPQILTAAQSPEEVRLEQGYTCSSGSQWE